MSVHTHGQAHSYIRTHDGDIDVFPRGDGPENPRCRWGRAVCLETPEHFVVELYAGDETEALTFCPRHYVLHLAYLLEVHLLHCPGTAGTHVLRYGRLV